jgi:hypothetical protein
MTFPTVHSDPATHGHVSFCATGEMTTPTNSPHVRGIEFRIPRLRNCPSVSVQIVHSVGAPPLVVYACKINDNVGGMTQIAIEAQTLEDQPAAGLYHCNIVAIGIPSPAA